MLLLVWNIKQLALSKITAPSTAAVIEAILNQYDVVVILEGQYGQGAALTGALNTLLGGNWNSGYVDTPALGRESESVLIMARPGWTIANIALFTPGNWGGFREPVSFDITGTMSFGGGGQTRSILTWHAPPDASDVTPCWATIRNSNVAQFQILCGDFNSTVVTPSGFTDAGVTSGATTLCNPGQDPRRKFTAERYDRIFVKNNVSFRNCGRVVPASHMVGQGAQTKSGRKRSAGMSERDAWDVQYRTSDHVPMRIEL